MAYSAISRFYVPRLMTSVNGAFRRVLYLPLIGSLLHYVSHFAAFSGASRKYLAQILISVRYLSIGILAAFFDCPYRY